MTAMNGILVWINANKLKVGAIVLATLQSIAVAFEWPPAIMQTVGTIAIMLGVGVVGTRVNTASKVADAANQNVADIAAASIEAHQRIDRLEMSPDGSPATLPMRR